MNSNYLHAVGELVDDDIIGFLLFWSGKHNMVSMEEDHHLLDVFLGLSGVDKEQVPPDDAVQAQ